MDTWLEEMPECRIVGMIKQASCLLGSDGLQAISTLIVKL